MNTVSWSVPAVLAIAGSDSSGGAGIQADIKTIAAHGLFAETAITALTAQNTCGVRDVMEATPQMVAEQIDAVFEDIPPAAVKVGMVSSAAIVEAIAERLEHWGAKNVVVDPVMVATSGARLIDDGAAGALVGRLLPLARVITPNIPEAEALTRTITSPSGAELCRFVERNHAVVNWQCSFIGEDFQSATAYTYDQMDAARVKIHTANVLFAAVYLVECLICAAVYAWRRQRL